MTAQPSALAPTGVHDPFGPGKLQQGVHDQFVAELNRIAQEAGITTGDITGQHYALTPFEVEYLKDFRRSHQTGKLGVLYVGDHQPAVGDRMRSVCGAVLRNFITARFIVREELVSELFDRRRQPRADLVAVPDFTYKDAPAATRRALGSWVMGRIARGQQTALGLSDKAAIGDLFGGEAPLYLKHFDVLHGTKLPT